MSSIPTQRLDIVEPAKANEEILAFARDLEAKGERAWFEVHYPKSEGLTDDELVFGDLDDHEDDEDDLDIDYAEQDEETFDAVEVIDGEIVTLPSYEKLGNPAEAQVK